MRTSYAVLIIYLFVLSTFNQACAQTNSGVKTAQIDTLYLAVTGMSCQKMCADGLDATFKKTEGVVYSKTSFNNSLSIIAYNHDITTEKKVIKIIEKRGFKTSVHNNQLNLR